MKNIITIIIGVGIISLSGCSSVNTIERDRNNDGKIDSIFYEYKGIEDRDYGFLDENYDGKFEVKEVHGYAFSREKVTPQLSKLEIENIHPEKE